MLTYGSASGSFAGFSGLLPGMIVDQSPTELDLNYPLTANISWINPGSGVWDVATNWSTGVVPGPNDVVAIDTADTATITIQSGDDIEIQSLTTGGDDTLSITGGSLAVTAGNSTLNGPLSMSGGSLTATGAGVDLTVEAATTISSANLYADAGASLNLPLLTSFTSDNNTFQADGTNSVLDVSAIDSVTQQGPWDIDATNGGTLDMGGFTSLTSTQGIDITDTGGSTLQDGELTNLDGVDVTLDGTDSQFTIPWTTFAGSITLTGGTQSIPNVTTLSLSGLVIDAGATLDVPLSTAQVTVAGDLTIGGTVDIGGNLTLTSASTARRADRRFAGDGACGAGRRRRLSRTGGCLQSRLGQQLHSIAGPDLSGNGVRSGERRLLIARALGSRLVPE